MLRCNRRAKLASQTLIFSALLTLPMILSGCFGTRTILIEPGTVVRTSKRIKTEVFAPDKDGKPVLSKAEIPAGAGVVVDPKTIKPIPQEVSKP